MSKPSRRTPAGLFLPLHATVAGRVRWQTLDERGVPEIPRNPSGFAIGPIDGVEQPNLITNLGLDRMAEFDALAFAVNTGTWRYRLAVGTGSTAPDVADTTLDAEVQRAATSGVNPAGSQLYELDGVANVWRATVLATRLVTLTADRNLTEFGFANAASGDILIRELFRDGGGTPITISLLNGKTIKVDHTLEVELPAPAGGIVTTVNIEEYDAANALVATLPYDIAHGGVAETNAHAAILYVFAMWRPHNGSLTIATDTAALRRITSSKAYDRIGMLTTSDLDPSANNAGIGTVALETYAGGTYQRIKRATAAAGEQNAAWQGFHFSWRRSGVATVGKFGGWVVLFTDPASYTKVDTDTMRCGIVSTWARAAEGS